MYYLGEDIFSYSVIIFLGRGGKEKEIQILRVRPEQFWVLKNLDSVKKIHCTVPLSMHCVFFRRRFFFSTLSSSFEDGGDDGKK